MPINLHSIEILIPSPVILVVVKQHRTIADATITMIILPIFTIIVYHKYPGMYLHQSMIQTFLLLITIIYTYNCMYK